MSQPTNLRIRLWNAVTLEGTTYLWDLHSPPCYFRELLHKQPLHVAKNFNSQQTHGSSAHTLRSPLPPTVHCPGPVSPTLSASTVIHPLFHFQCSLCHPLVTFPLVSLPLVLPAPLVQSVSDASVTLSTLSLAPHHLQRTWDSLTRPYCLVDAFPLFSTTHLEPRSS